jgi:hypothetical protein
VSENTLGSTDELRTDEAQNAETRTGDAIMETETKLRNFKAINGFSGLSIISVLAKDETKAREKITEQLNRPGRYGAYRIWCDTGKTLKSFDW